MRRAPSASKRWPRALPSELLIPRLVTGDAAAAQAFYDDALARGHEGVMVKSLDGAVRAGRAQRARGSRSSARTRSISSCSPPSGARPPQGLAVEPASRRARPGERRVRHARQDLQGNDRRDARVADRGAARRARSRATTGPCHVRPELVVEIAFNDVQASPHYPGGLALRFARVKGYRPDKSAQEADTIDTAHRASCGANFHVGPRRHEPASA